MGRLGGLLHWPLTEMTWTLKSWPQERALIEHWVDVLLQVKVLPLADVASTTYKSASMLASQVTAMSDELQFRW